MKVSEAISMLTHHYNPEDDVVIAWWDKEWVDNDIQGKPLTEDQWVDLVEYLDERGDNLGEQMSYDIRNAITVLEQDWKKND